MLGMSAEKCAKLLELETDKQQRSNDGNDGNNNLTDDDNDDSKKNALTNTGPWFYAMTFSSFPPHHLTFRVLLLHHFFSSFSTSSFTSPCQTSKEEIW